MKQLKLFTVDFTPAWPVPCGLIILAYDIYEATDIALETVIKGTPIIVSEILMDAPKVVFYESGEY